MPKEIGKATIKGKKMYFDEVGWKLVKQVAKRKKKSPTLVVQQAVRAYMRTYVKKN